MHRPLRSPAGHVQVANDQQPRAFPLEFNTAGVASASVPALNLIDPEVQRHAGHTWRRHERQSPPRVPPCVCAAGEVADALRLQRRETANGQAGATRPPAGRRGVAQIGGARVVSGYSRPTGTFGWKGEHISVADAWRPLLSSYLC